MYPLSDYIDRAYNIPILGIDRVFDEWPEFDYRGIGVRWSVVDRRA